MKGAEREPLIVKIHRVLLMDDDADHRILVERMAVRLGFEAETVADSNELIVAVRESQKQNRHFDVVILDVTIPGGKGAVEVVGDLKTLAPNLPAIVTSGWTSHDVIVNCQSYGFAAALPKPFSTSQLAEVINSAIG